MPAAASRPSVRVRGRATQANAAECVERATVQAVPPYGAAMESNPTAGEHAVVGERLGVVDRGVLAAADALMSVIHEGAGRVKANVTGPGW